MAIPVFLQGDFRFRETAGVTDVNTIISDLLSELVTNGSWTDLGGNVYKSPADFWGRYAKLALTRNAATDLGVSITDHAGATVCAGKILIDAGGTTVRYYTGPGHCVVESARATPEHFRLFRLNPHPDPDGILLFPWVAMSYRDSAGTARTSTYATSFGYSYATGAYVNTDRHFSGTFGSNNVYMSRCRTMSGALFCLPYDAYISGPTDYAWAGRAPHALLVNSSVLDGAEITVPVDAGVTGTFKAVGGTAQTGYAIKLAMRKA